MKHSIIYIALVMLSAGCGNENAGQQSEQGNQINWPEEEKKLIMEECLQDVRNNALMPEHLQENFCDCMLEKIMIAYPDGSTARGSFENHKINDIVTECELSVQ